MENFQAVEPRVATYIKHSRAAMAAVLLAAMLVCCSGPPGAGLKESIFRNLAETRHQRKVQVVEKLETLMALARSAPSNPVLAGAFSRFHDASIKAGQGSFTPAEDTELDRAYLERYYYFYDILFVGADGLVFHTIRRESDLGKNLFTSGLAATMLAKKLAGGKPVEFVDFHYYSPSKEPAAFFVAAAPGADGKPAGWMVFQFSSNALREIMSSETGLGSTAEVYLANENKVMLTQSRLLPQGAGLSLRVETEAVEKAMKIGEGSAVITDYRGVRVFSSFEKLQFAGANWVVIAEVDEEEALTRHFMEHRDYYYPKTLELIQAGAPTTPEPEWLFDENVKVDINEYASAGPGEIISTAGVTTCTAVAVKYPGKFVYLGHIFPLDRVYYGRWEKPLVDMYYRLTGGVYGDKVTNLMGAMTSDILQFRVYPSQVRALQATLIATHKNSFARIVDSLLDSGLYLSQIRVLQAPEAKYVDVGVDVNSGRTVAQWVGRAGEARWTEERGTPTLEDLAKRVMNYQQ